MIASKDSVCEAYFKQQAEQLNTLKLNSKIKIKNAYTIEESETESVYPLLEYVKGNHVTSEKAEITSFFIKDRVGDFINALEINQEYTFHIIVRCYEIIENGNVGIRFENKKGVAVYGTNTFLTGNESKVEMRAGKTLEIVFRATIPELLADEYLITIAITDGIQEKFEVVTWLNNIAKINILNESKNDVIVNMNSSINIIEYRTQDVRYSK
jgi:hypothetical protein